MRSICLGLILLMPAVAASHECENVIALGRTINVRIEDRDSIEKHATSFCRDYVRSTSSDDGASLSVSHNFLAASLGLTNASAEFLASRYCAADGDHTARTNVYRHYVETISPNAYTAYEQCLRMSSQNMRFSVDLNTVLAGEFSLRASYISPSNRQTSATVAFAASSGVTCSWDGLEGNLREIKSGSSSLLHCRRADITKPSYVHVSREDTGTEEEKLSLPWKAYTPDGVPADSVAMLSNRLATLERRLNDAPTNHGILLLSGTVSLRAVDTRPLTDPSKCPDDETSSRGELKGRVRFSKPFASTPTVSIGFSHIDARGSDATDFLRLDVHVDKVDPNGFDYSFSTWCRTVVNAASASWIAVGDRRRVSLSSTE